MKRVKFIFAWYDFWVGLFYDQKKRTLYIFIIPMIGIVIDLSKQFARRKRLHGVNIKTNSDGFTALEIFKMPECPIVLPKARSMTTAGIDWKTYEPKIFEWYESYKKRY